MATTLTTKSHHSPNAFRRFDQTLERVLGADMRLLYGMAVPVLMVVGVILALALQPSAWLVAAVMLLEIGALGIVVYGFVGMLNESDEDGPAPS